MKNTIFLLLFSLLIFTPGCMQIDQKQLIYHMDGKKHQIQATHQLPNSINTESKTTNPPQITIWVHGTRLLPKGVLKNFFYCKPGLNHYTSIEPKYHQRKIVECLIDADPKQFSAEYFYIFGWNGKLSFEEREIAARQLYLELKEVRSRFIEKYGIEPFIRILSHSHGGNVSLLLAQVKDAKDFDFFINQLILMGTPVQERTKEYVCANCFGKVYSLYSMMDILQIIDPQGFQQKDTNHLFSERLFPVNNKIEQVAIKMNKRSILHMEFVKRSFISQVPKIIAEIDSWKNSTQLDAYAWAKKEKCLCINTKESITRS